MISCSEPESVYHIFYDCVVARQIWVVISESLGSQVGQNFESVAKKWLFLVRILSSDNNHRKKCTRGETIRFQTAGTYAGVTPLKLITQVDAFLV
jgi:hypothetical protein